MAIRVNRATGRDSSGRVTYERGGERPTYRKRDGGGFERGVAQTNQALGDREVSADRGLARGLADREAVRVQQERREYLAQREALLAQEGGGGGFSTIVDGGEGFSSEQLVFMRGGGRFSDLAASSPGLVASTRRSPNEFITSEGERIVPTTSLSSGGFLARDVLSPRQSTNREALNVYGFARRDPVFRAAEFGAEYRRNYRTTVGGFAGRAAVPFENFSTGITQNMRPEFGGAILGSPARGARWVSDVGAGYFRAREQTPELFFLDAAAVPLGYGAGALAGRGTNYAVQGLARAAPVASPTIVRLGGTAGTYALGASAAFGALEAARNPRGFGATGLTSIAFFGGAARGYRASTGLQYGPVRYGRPTTPELRTGEYGNALTFYTTRNARQSVTVFGRPGTTRTGVSGLSGSLEAVRGGYAGRAESFTTLRGATGITDYRDAFLIAPTSQRQTLGALRFSDRGLFAVTGRSRTDRALTSLNLDPFRRTTGRVARLDDRGRVLRSQPYRLGSTDFQYRGASQFRTAQAGNGLFTVQEFRTAPGLRTFATAQAFKPTTARAPPGYGRAAVEGLRRQGYLPENFATPRISRRGQLGGQAQRTATQQLPRLANRSPRLDAYRALGQLPGPRATTPRAALIPLALNIQIPRQRQTPLAGNTFLPVAPQRYDTRATSLYQQLPATGLASIQRQQLRQTQQLGQQQITAFQPVPTRGFDTLPPPPPIIPSFFPPGLPALPGGGALPAGGRSARSAAREFEYAPSLAAILGNVRASNAPTRLGGLEVRPIVVRRRRR